MALLRAALHQRARTDWAEAFDGVSALDAIRNELAGGKNPG